MYPRRAEFFALPVSTMVHAPRPTEVGPPHQFLILAPLGFNPGVNIKKDAPP